LVCCSKKNLATLAPTQQTRGGFLKQNSVPELAKSDKSWAVCLLKHVIKTG
jgi:hypothetical protein